MWKWLAENIESVVSAISASVVTVFLFGWYAKGKIGELESQGKQIEALKQIAENNSKGLRIVQDDQIELRSAVDDIKDLKEQSRNNGLMLARIAGKLDID